ncbi:hypothetical protein [Flavihumibacter sp. ZG627]|uniref:hypothetical protein n=1 Tax=Flavihumibacter sp. ZG627 TaxID=1463156 RepID=UPI00057DC79E|nr:hypothetical protein [Flavihumibacter sp. ZG627]KIC90003.1 hypothetical protein HY58_13415 [Flavihumibacter sp. ZG627]
MPFYKITYTTAAGKLVSGIRQFHLKSIDDTFNHFLNKAKQNEPNLSGYQCYMISELSDEFKDYQQAKNSRKRSPQPTQQYNRKKGTEGPSLENR